MQIKTRKWEKFINPLHAVGHNMVKEFYANAWEPEKDKRKPCTYTTMVQGKDISFAPKDIKRVLKRCKNACALKEENGSILPTTNRSKLTVERAVLIHSIIIGENINVEEIIADQIYNIIAALCLDAKITTPKDDTLIPQELPIVGEAMQQEFPSNFYTHFDNSMSMIYRRLDSQQEESRKSFEALNTRMNRFDDQLSYLCYSTQMTNEQMLSLYQDTTRLMREMEMQGIPVTMANLAIHRQKRRRCAKRG
ncbi:hypothetical protein PIB30_001739 [Stylosanthes scabra]|uniref:Putative plant transposon protein domain-containing protein n=1 Tax=Stylosanthes scabra TaxID=79078 RepID=A0ABU6V490_9FABA|nr:hypothetical protein [Stylosanthes scabra]